MLTGYQAQVGYEDLKKENERLKKQLHDLMHCICGEILEKGYCERCDHIDNTVFMCHECDTIMLCPCCDKKEFPDYGKEGG
jgi:hypothetical protein